MASSNAAYAAYNQNNMGIDSPQKLISMLYEGILRFIYRAKKAMDEGDIENKVLKSYRNQDAEDVLEQQKEEDKLKQKAT